jgi:RNA polymerase sigma-70 factor (ECF subfamily)
MPPFQHVPTADELRVYHLPDPELIAGAREGKDAHIGVLRHKYGPLVYEAAARLAPAAASEIVDDVFLDLPRLLAGYTREEGKFVQYLRQAVRNRARTAARSDRHRARRVLPLPSRDVLPSPGRTLGRTAEEWEVKARVLGELGERERAVCELFAQGYKHAEIAERLGISEANSQQIVSRAKKRLNARYRELMDE